VFVGIARFVLRIPNSQSLKDRRHVVRSFKGRLASRLNVSVAEVGDVERHQIATLGVVTVSRESGICRRVLDDVRRIASTLPDALLMDVKGEILSMGQGGGEIRGGIEELLTDKDGWFVEPKETP
jgi:uncharacterized protein YlxP (DUF503 family)